MFTCYEMKLATWVVRMVLLSRTSHHSNFHVAYILTIDWRRKGNVFGQHGSSFTEYQHTHFLSTDWQFVRSAWLQLHGISAHSLPVNRLAICSVSMAPASRNISTLTLCQQIGNLFGQDGSSFTEYQHTHSLSTDW